MVPQDAFESGRHLRVGRWPLAVFGYSCSCSRTNKTCQPHSSVRSFGVAFSAAAKDVLVSSARVVLPATTGTVLALSFFLSHVFDRHARTFPPGRTLPPALLWQLVLDCWNTGDWGGIAGYPVKFAIGFVSVFFDLIFLLQV